MPKSTVRKKKKGKRPPPRAVEPVKAQGPSPTWYIALMFGLIALGGIIIILNYIGLVPGDTGNRYLIAGLVAIAVGFGMTLNFR